jgi:hypothetical protein
MMIMPRALRIALVTPAQADATEESNIHTSRQRADFAPDQRPYSLSMALIFPAYYGCSGVKQIPMVWAYHSGRGQTVVLALTMCARGVVLPRRATHNRLFTSMATLRTTLRNNISYFQTMRQRVLSFSGQCCYTPHCRTLMYAGTHLLSFHALLPIAGQHSFSPPERGQQP